MSRDQLANALATGKVDMVAAMVTVRPELEKVAAFSEPTRTNVSQVLVTGPGAPPIATVDDLSGQEVFVRKASVYHETLTSLNEQLKARGKPAVVIIEAPDVLEDDDVLEMVNAGLAPITVVDDYLAEFWSQVFTRHQGAQRRRLADRRQPGRRLSQGQSPASERRSTSGSSGTERVMHSGTWSNADISTTSST